MDKLNLRNTLMLNATLTLPFAIILLTFADTVAQLLGGMQVLAIQLLGALLVLFSMTAWFSAKSANINLAKLITVLDISWILASGALVILNPLNMSILATVLVMAIAIFVLFCAVFQLRGIHQGNIPA